MTIYSSTSFNEALELSRSTLEGFFDGKPFDNLLKHKENEGKNVAGICERLNEVIRGCNAICKTIARAR